MSEPLHGEPLHGEALLRHMESLLEAWRPSPDAVQPEIPLLTDTGVDTAEDGEDGEATPPVPAGLTREILQLHLADAAEKVMLALYRDLSADLNERMAAEMRRLVDQGIQRATRTLRQQILVSISESLTRSVEQAGNPPPARPGPPASKSRP